MIAAFKESSDGRAATGLVLFAALAIVGLTDVRRVEARPPTTEQETLVKREYTVGKALGLQLKGADTKVYFDKVVRWPRGSAIQYVAASKLLFA